MISYHEDADTPYPQGSNFRTIGLCTGLLAAASCISARSLSELIPVALESVRLAFRVGTLVGNANDVLNGENASESWSTIITDVVESDVRESIDQFHSAARIEPSARAYLSALSSSAVTISGPSSTTARILQECSGISDKTQVPLPITSPYHAPHLFSEADIDGLFDQSSRRTLEQFSMHGLLHSGVTSATLEPTDSFRLMHNVATQSTLR